MRFNKILLALCMFFLISAGTVGAATPPPVVQEVTDRGEIDQVQCDGMEEDSIKVGETINFFVSFSTKNNAKVQVSGIEYWFWSDIDYNGGDPGITFAATKEFRNADGIIQNQNMKMMRSSDYMIRSAPEKPSKENILVKYKVTYNSFNPDGTLSPQEEHITQCARYRVVPTHRK